MSTYTECDFAKGEFHNYYVAGNVFNAFALGEIGSQDDFFLIGAEPDPSSSYPLLTGNILDSAGNVLFRLVRNVLVFNPGHCSRVFGDRLGYEIHDGDGKPIFKIETRWFPTADHPDSKLTTTLLKVRKVMHAGPRDS